MEGLSLLLIIIVLVLVVSMKNGMTERMSNLEAEIRKLREYIQSKTFQQATTSEKPAREIIPEVKPSAPQKENWKSGFNRLEEEPLAKEPEMVANTEEPEVELKPIETSVSGQDDETLPVAAFQAVEKKPARKSFFERNPDLEKFIGENLVSKIGIGILVLAIAYFVKYAIDNNWVGEIGRVAIGIICGGILVGLAHKMRNGYAAFSSVLVGGGLAVFYFTIALGYHQFHLFSQSMAFVIMVVITGFAVALSLLYNRQEVAVIAMVGGFLTPFMASSGSGNYVTLFIYLIILNVGLLIIAYNKAWRILNILAFIFTVIIFGAWLFDLPYEEKPVVYRNGFLFATIFYILFYAINLANNIKDNKKFIASDFSILLANTALYFSAGLYCIYMMEAEAYKGLFSALLAVVNLSVSFLLFRNKKTDINILYLLIGITLTFISLTAPLQLKGNYITIFWASEAVLLYWLFTVSKIKMFRITALTIYAAMAISLVLDWNNIYFTNSEVIVVMINKGFITTLYAALASFVFYRILHRQPINESKREASIFGRIQLLVVSLVLLYLSGALEVYYQFFTRRPGFLFNTQYLLLYTFLFVVAFILIAEKFAKSLSHPVLRVVLCVVMVVLFFGSAPTMYTVQRQVLQSGTNSLHFIIPQMVMAGLLIFIFMQLVNFVRSEHVNNKPASIGFTWLLAAAIVGFLSIEVHLLARHMFYSASLLLPEIDRVFGKTVLPILWGVCSFAFMWLGMKFKFKTLRIISLSLFTGTLLKLFIFDIQNIPVAGKIAAFFSLGVLLLVVSFMYQRLKKIIVEDEKPVE